MINKIKKKIKSFLKINKKYSPKYNWCPIELSQKRMCEKWSVMMLAEYYNVNEYYMREVLDFYNIK